MLKDDFLIRKNKTKYTSSHRSETVPYVAKSPSTSYSISTPSQELALDSHLNKLSGR